MEEKNAKEIQEGMMETMDSSKEDIYLHYKKECDCVIENHITDEERLDSLLDKLLDFYDDQRFADLFWKIVNYVETFDSWLGPMYRRVEEVLTQGY